MSPEQSSASKRPIQRGSAKDPLPATDHRKRSEPLTVSEYGILGLLSFGEKSGYELFRFADRSIGFIWAPAKSQIYKVLPRLAAMGLSQTRLVEQSQRPDKQLHRLTPAGRRALRQWLTRVEIDDDPDIYLLKIFFGRQAGQAALADQVSAYRDQITERLTRYEELDRWLTRDEHNALPLQVLALGPARVRATLDWADALLAELSPPNTGAPPKRARRRR
jgi:DNA-binding PadR family transcriptional regulator